MTSMRMLCLWIPLCLFLTGCWDQKVIQDTFYVVGVGADYKDNKYIVYLQLSDFSSIAKSDQGKPSEKIPVWIATGTGSTLFDAIRNVKATSQQRIVFSHVSSYILTEAAIKHGFEETLDLIRRYPDFRLTGWIFGTKDNIKQIFTSTPVFYTSPLVKIEHNPQGIAKQYNRIPPLEARDFYMQYRDTARTVLLPSLSLSDSWYEDDKPNPLPYINGAFVFQNSRYHHWMSDQALSGYRWTTPTTQRSILRVEDKQKGTTMELAIWNVKPSIKALIKNGAPVFDIHVKGKATILNQVEESDKENQLVNEEIKKEIKTTFNKGLKKEVDVLNLENSLYRKQHQVWKQTFKKNQLIINRIMLGDIKVDIKVVQSGKIRFDSQ